MRNSFSAQVNQNDAVADNADPACGVIKIVGSKTSGKPYIWVGEVFTSYRAIISARSMDAVCRAWISLRKLRGEWKP